MERKSVGEISHTERWRERAWEEEVTLRDGEKERGRNKSH